MTRNDWPQLATALKGIWPRRELQPGSLYLRLLKPYPMAAIEEAVDGLARTSRYAPSPSELLQALGAVAPSCTCTPELLEEWSLVAEQLRAALGEVAFEVWLAKAHPHERTATGWVLGAPPTVAKWVSGRYGPTLDRIAGGPVRIDACEQLGGFR